MKLEDIVCDFEYAEKLKELGLRRESIFAFNRVGGLFNYAQLCYSNIFPTFTVSELGEMLPSQVQLPTEDYADFKDPETWALYHFCSKLCNDKDRYSIMYVNYQDCWLGQFIAEDKKEVNVRAQLLIWLIENKHVNVEDLNNAT
jgi:hypothetical protein